MLENLPRPKRYPDKKTIIISVVILILVALSALLGVGYFLQYQETQKIQAELSKQKLNAGVINFLDLFIGKVLKSQTEVSFDDRLKLENAIRNLNDPDLLAKWEAFTNATDQQGVQIGVENLLEALVKKISY
ncbi:MAG: hypothetical protein NTY81_01295 [Candidatus Staskawiczbacteria bacterium]|nr:hypothetical protein [Candidatus Staskawiczbacteria bacterium]